MNMDILDILEILNGGSAIMSKLRITDLDGSNEIIVNQDDSIKNWTYKDDRYIEGEGFIGQFVARTLEGNLQNISDSFNIENKKIELFIGINREGIEDSNLVTEIEEFLMTESGNELICEGEDGETTHYYSLGTFIVDEPTDNEVVDNTKFTSLDYTCLFNITFNPDYTDTTYTKSFDEKLEDGETVTALWLEQYVCAQCGVTVGNDDWTNYDFVIDSNQFDSTSNCRDVIKAIAKLAYSWARIGWDDKLYIDFEVADISEIEDYDIITNDEYYNLETQKNIYGPINKVVLANSVIEGDSAYVEDSESIEEYGLHELDIYDNPFLYTTDLKENIKDTAEVLFGLEYTPLTTQTIGHPWLKGNELIKIKDMEDNYKYTYPFNKTIEYFGHIRTTLTSYAKTSIQEEYTYDGDDSQDTFTKVTRARLDRDEQQFEVYMEKTDTNTSNISTQSQTLNSYQTRIETIENNYATTGELEQLSNSVTTLQTNTYTKTEINTKLTDGSVTKVDTTTGFTMDATGFHVDKTGADTNSTLDEKGLSVKDSSDNDVSYVGYVDSAKVIDNPNLTAYEGQTVTYQENAIINHYLQLPNSRIEAYGNGTGVFFTG